MSSFGSNSKLEAGCLKICSSTICSLPLRNTCSVETFLSLIPQTCRWSCSSTYQKHPEQKKEKKKKDDYSSNTKQQGGTCCYNPSPLSTKYTHADRLMGWEKCHLIFSHTLRFINEVLRGKKTLCLDVEERK